MPPPSFIATTATASGLRSGYLRDHHLTQQRLRCEKVRLLYDNLWQPVLSRRVIGGCHVARGECNAAALLVYDTGGHFGPAASFGVPF